MLVAGETYVDKASAFRDKSEFVIVESSTVDRLNLAVL